MPTDRFAEVCREIVIWALIGASLAGAARNCQQETRLDALEEHHAD